MAMVRSARNSTCERTHLTHCKRRFNPTIRFPGISPSRADLGIRFQATETQVTDTAFAPESVYNERIDSLLFFVSDELSHRRRVNRLLTAFISDETGDVVGIEIKGIRRVVENMRRVDANRVVYDHGFRLTISRNDGDESIDCLLELNHGIYRFSDEQRG